MKFLFNATPFALIAMLASGCGYDYTCKGLEENAKKGEKVPEGDKAAAMDYANHMTSYFESWPTSGETLECTLANGNKVKMIFSQEAKDEALSFWKEAKKSVEAMP